MGLFWASREGRDSGGEKEKEPYFLRKVSPTGIAMCVLAPVMFMYNSLQVQIVSKLCFLLTQYSTCERGQSVIFC